MAKNLFAQKPNKFKEMELHKSAGILDDFAVRKNVATSEGTIEKVPVNDSDIVNKKYVDDEISAIPAPDLSPYWKSDGSSTATGNWNLISHNLTTTGTISGGTLTDGTLSVTGGTITGACGSNSMWINDEGYLTSVAFADLTDYPADAEGVLTNDGAGNLSWGAGGGAISFFDLTDAPADPDADKYLKWDDTAGELVWADAGAGGGASTALDNLASVAINLSLISDTDNTDDLGSSAKEWKDLYIDGIAYIDEIKQADNEKHYFGTGDDASITYNGTNWLFNPKAVGTGYLNIQGQTLVDDKIMFTQTDGNEYIDSLDDGYLDLGATTRIRLHTDTRINGGLGINAPPIANNVRIDRTGGAVGIICNRTDGACMSLSAGLRTSAFRYADDMTFTIQSEPRADILSATGENILHVFQIDNDANGNNVKLLLDNQKLYFGAGQDAWLKYNGTNLVINPKEVGSGILDVTGTLQTDGYNSADGSAGITTTFVDGDGNTITIKNGLVTAKTAP
jgi:hypothetical protein